MSFKRYIGSFWRDGFHAVRSGWNRTLQRVASNAASPSSHRLAYALCAAGLLAFAGGLLAAGTGTVDPASGWYPAGTNLTAVATPQMYSAFDSWTGDTNGAAIVSTQISFNVTAPRTVTATFIDRLTVSNSVPYWWLASVGITSNFESEVTVDTDGDGFTTAEEYWSGTDPQTNTSYLHIEGVEATSSNVLLIWAHAKIDTNSIPQISIQRRSDMINGNWVHVTNHVPVNGTNTWLGPLPDNGFFRLSATNMP